MAPPVSGIADANRWRAAVLDGDGECPACGSCLAVEPRADDDGNLRPPSLYLEVSGRSGRHGWRLRVLGRRSARSSNTPEPAFNAADWRYRFWICGSGHYYLAEFRPLPGAVDETTWRRHGFAAAIGQLASGKSYLVVRTVNQSMTPVGVSFDPVHRLGRDASVAIEGTPRSTLERLYSATYRPMPETPGKVIEPTRLDELHPGAILAEQFAEQIQVQAKQLQEEVLGRDLDPDPWGTSVYQPVVLRHTVNTESVLTGVADLSGELFNWDDQGFAGDQSLSLSILRQCNAVIWVVDPVTAGGVMQAYLRKALEDAEFSEAVIGGSSRPGSFLPGDDSASTRDIFQEKVANQISSDRSLWERDSGGTRDTLVVITKSDLVHLGLEKLTLAEFGEEGLVLDGIDRYLRYIAEEEHGPPVEALLHPIMRYLRTNDLPDEPARRSRRRQVAGGLLAYYSDAGAFWDLVHRGQDTAQIIISGAADPRHLENRSLVVPDVERHLADSLPPGSANRMQCRDLVLSALGCGVLYGLGYAGVVEDLLAQPWREVRFFLASPLGNVPVEAGDGYIKPRSGRFARLTERSAALTQLQRRVLRRVRP